MELIKEKRFTWNSTIITELKKIFDVFFLLENLICIKFINIDFFIKNFPPIYFYNYINLNYGRIGGNKIYDDFMKLGSVMLQVFKNHYLLKDLIYLPRIHTETCYLLDPAYR